MKSFPHFENVGVSLLQCPLFDAMKVKSTLVCLHDRCHYLYCKQTRDSNCALKRHRNIDGDTKYDIKNCIAPKSAV